jgi:hypothetical protein
VDWKRLDDPQAFATYISQVQQFVRTVVAHYKDHIRFWMTENEINAPGYLVSSGFTKKPLWTLDQALQISKAIAIAIREASPQAVITLMTSPMSADWLPSAQFIDPLRFAKLSIDTGVPFDALGFETYLFDGSPADFYEYMQKVYGLGKSVFLVEVAYWSCVPPVISDQGLQLKWNTFDEATQAKWLEYMLTYAFGTSSVGFNWFMFRDFPASYYQGQGGGEDFLRLEKCAGLVSESGNPKQAYYTYQRLIRSWTTNGTAVTDATGTLEFMGFAGNYSISIDGYMTSRFHVTDQGGSNTITLAMKPSVKSTTIKSTTISLSGTVQQVQTPTNDRLYLIAAMAIAAILAVLGIPEIRKKRNPK